MLGAAIDRETRCIEDVVLNAVVEKHPVQPESVVACLVAAHRPHPATPLPRSFACRRPLSSSNRFVSPPGIACTLILSPSRGANVATSQVARLNSMARKSVFLKSWDSAFTVKSD